MQPETELGFRYGFSHFPNFGENPAGVWNACDFRFLQVLD